MSRLAAVGLSVCVLLICVGAKNADESDHAATSAAKADSIRPIEAANPVELDNIAKIRKALDGKTTLDFKKTPLGDVVSQLATQHQIEIRLDAKTLEEASIGVNTEVTCNRRDVSLHSALRSMLRPMDLAYIIRDESLVITTPDRAQNELTTKVYPVGDLLAGPRRLAGGNNFQQLINMISSTVGPTTWDEVGGPGSIQEFTNSRSLVVSQTDEMHEQIGELLTALRQARNAQPPAPPPTAMDSLVDTVGAVSAAWHRGAGRQRGNGACLVAWGAARCPPRPKAAKSSLGTEPSERRGNSQFAP